MGQRQMLIKNDKNQFHILSNTKAKLYRIFWPKHPGVTIKVFKILLEYSIMMLSLDISLYESSWMNRSPESNLFNELVDPEISQNQPKWCVHESNWSFHKLNWANDPITAHWGLRLSVIKRKKKRGGGGLKGMVSPQNEFLFFIFCQQPDQYSMFNIKQQMRARVVKHQKRTLKTTIKPVRMMSKIFHNILKPYNPLTSEFIN